MICPNISRGAGLAVAWLAVLASVWVPAVAVGQVRPAAGPYPPGWPPVLQRPGVGELGPSGPGLDQAGCCPECGAALAAPDRGNCFDFPLLGLFRGVHNALHSYRHLGHPLQRESWLYRPFSAGWFMGGVEGSPLIDDWVGMKQGFCGGYRFGWDENYYFGGEMRFSFASVALSDAARAIQAQWDADTAAGIAEDDPWRNRFDARRDADLFHWDITLLYYPWGDTQWRPYLLFGLGVARVDFIDRLSNRYAKTVFAMPVGVGLKWRLNDWLALRFECADNVAFGGSSGFDTLNNAWITGGVEVRFGGTRKAYWPWNPGRYYW